MSWVLFRASNTILCENAVLHDVVGKVLNIGIHDLGSPAIHIFVHFSYLQNKMK